MKINENAFPSGRRKGTRRHFAFVEIKRSDQTDEKLEADLP
ncbi:hypothetical protein [Bacillus sp. THAF10]|nr:hypothetical protein [Bacillus sp. THAF10]